MSYQGGKNKSVNMTTGRVLPSLLSMAIPLAASSVLQLMFNAADLAVVGNFASSHSLAAVGSTGPLINFVVTLFVGLSLGSNALISRYLGAQDEARARDALHCSIFVGLASGAFLTVFGIVVARQSLIWMQSPSETLDLATIYFQVYSGGMIPLMLYNFGSAILRSKGDTKRPLYYLCAAGVVNVALNLFFVIVLKMDVAGVALATDISQGLAAFLVLRCLMNEEGVFRLDLRRVGFYKTETFRILQIGIPAGFQGIVFSLSNIVIQSSINGFGPIVMAGSAAAQNIEGCVWLTMNSFSQCAMTIESQNLGAQKYSRLNHIAVVCCVSCAVAGMVLGNISYLFGPYLIGIFDQRPEAIEAGMVRVFYVCCFYWTCGLMDCLSCVIRGLGYNMAPTVVSLLGACGTRIVWIATIFQVDRFHTEGVLFFSYPGSWVLTVAIHLACYILIRRSLPQVDGGFEERIALKA